MKAQDDLQLLRRWLDAGDREAGNELFERYFRQIEGYFMNAVGDQERLDLTQETFLCLTRSASRFMGRSSFRTYLFGIAHNVLRDHLRRKTRAFDPLVDTIEDLAGLTPSRVVSQVARHDRLLQSIRGLPFESQQLLELYYWHGMSAAECGQIFGLEPGTVRRRVHEIRRALQAQLGKSEPAGAGDLKEQLAALAKILFAEPA